VNRDEPVIYQPCRDIVEPDRPDLRATRWP